MCNTRLLATPTTSLPCADSSEPGSGPDRALLAPRGRAGLGVLFPGRALRWVKVHDAAQEEEGRLIRLQRTPKPQLTHPLNPKLEKTGR